MFNCFDNINKEKKCQLKNGFEKFEFWWIRYYLFQIFYDIIFGVFVLDLINNCFFILGSILERGVRGWYV